MNDKGFHRAYHNEIYILMFMVELQLLINLCDLLYRTVIGNPFQRIFFSVVFRLLESRKELDKYYKKIFFKGFLKVIALLYHPNGNDGINRIDKIIFKNQLTLKIMLR